MCNIIITKSKEGDKLVIFTGYGDDNESITTIHQQFYEAKPRKVVAV